MSENFQRWEDWDESEEEESAENAEAVHPMPPMPPLPAMPLMPLIPPMPLLTGQTNHLIIPLTQSILNALLAVNSNYHQPIQQEQEQEQELSSEPESEPEPKRIKTNAYESYAFTLTSGEEFYFTEKDGKNILLNKTIEPNIWVRKIISNLPSGIRERLRYLAKFRFDEKSEDDTESDTDEGHKPHSISPKKFSHVPTQVFSAYIREMKLRTIFRGVLARWRIYHLNKKECEEIDPITLSSPIKKVELYDWKHKRKYIFDATSLATLIESKLLYHEYGFAMPNYPRNPWTNIEFTYYEMVSIYYQLQKHSELRWGLITLKQHDFNKHSWQLYHKSALTMKAIRNNITLLDNRDAQDMLEDFIFQKWKNCK